MIRKMYGLTFREKYRRITRNIPIIAEKKFRVIDEALFEDMVNDSVYILIFRMGAASTTTRLFTSKQFLTLLTNTLNNIALTILEMDNSSPGRSRCLSQ